MNRGEVAARPLPVHAEPMCARAGQAPRVRVPEGPMCMLELAVWVDVPKLG